MSRHTAVHSFQPIAMARTKTALRRQARMRTVEMLCTLLREDPELRAKWARHAPSGGRGIHQGAIARVLADHQWATGEEPLTNADLPRRLKDTVSRALSGKSLSQRSLELFIRAFEMDAETAECLWATWKGSDQVFEPYVESPSRADTHFGRSRRTVSVSA